LPAAFESAAAGAPVRSGARRAALGSLAAAAGIAIAKLVVGVAAGSLAILSDALHSFFDATATAVTFYAVRLADKPPDREHPFGHGRAENLAALGESALLVVFGIFVGIEAVRRLMSGRAIVPARYAIAVVAASIVVDVTRARALRRAAHRYSSQALEADALNFTADVLGSTAVLAGLVASRLGFAAGDPLAALAVVVLVSAMAVRLAVGAVEVLMDRTPEGLDDRLRAAAAGVGGVVDVHQVRVRRSGPHVLAEVTVSVGRTHSVERSHDIAEAVRARLADAVPGTTAVVRVLPSEAGEDVVRRVFAAANRVGLADQIHNVMAIRHPDGTWLTLHAKVHPDVPLARADQITDVLEDELRREFDGLARVDIHLEPREPQRLEGRVATAERPEMVREVSAIAAAYPPIERCHEVVVSEASGGLYLVLHCDAAAERTIGEIHEASLKVEAEIHRRFPEVANVTIHFEPAQSLSGS
jgi:cation diffusion facilitator family transporter